MLFNFHRKISDQFIFLRVAAVVLTLHFQRALIFFLFLFYQKDYTKKYIYTYISLIRKYSRWKTERWPFKLRLAIGAKRKGRNGIPPSRPRVENCQERLRGKKRLKGDWSKTRNSLKKVNFTKVQDVLQEYSKAFVADSMKTCKLKIPPLPFEICYNGGGCNRIDLSFTLYYCFNIVSFLETIRISKYLFNICFSCLK